MTTPTAFATNTPRAISRAEWQHIHDHSATVYKSSEFFRESILGVARLRREVFRPATGHVLDVACGYGANFRYLSNATQIIGVDFSPVMLQMAQTQTQQLPMPVQLRAGDAEALDFADESFDTVVSTFTTCSLLDPVAALREMRRVCKRSGRILLLEHGRSEWEWLGHYQDQTVGQMIEDGGCRWNQEPLDLVHEAGLTVINSRRSHLGICHLIEISPN